MRIGAILLIALVLSGCGSSTGDRAASGAGIGATAGAVLGAVTGMSVLQGVVIGAAAGGVIGAATDESTVNLGEPVWAEKNEPANKAAISRVQAGLARMGYKPGPLDGVLGPRTREAIQLYQRQHGLLVDGRPTIELARHIETQLQLVSK